MQITTIAIPATARRVVAPYNTMSEICTKPKAPSPRELSPQVTEGVFHPQAIVQNPRHHPSASLTPSSERRANRKPTCDDVVDCKVRFANIKESFGFFIHRCTESNCHSAKNISPATRPWVGSVARKAPAYQNSRTESNKTPTATPKPAPAQGAKRVEQK